MLEFSCSIVTDIWDYEWNIEYVEHFSITCVRVVLEYHWNTTLLRSRL